MNILIDTNILIKLEPYYSEDPEFDHQESVDFLSICRKNQVNVFIHPSTKDDISNDRDQKRRDIRLKSLKKYQLLKDPPVISSEFEKKLGESNNKHDVIDHKILYAVYHRAVSYLITEDQKLLKKAKRLNISDSVLSLPDALELFKTLFDSKTDFPEQIIKTYVYNLDEKDSHSKINKLQPGDIVLFYRSRDFQTIQAIGVIEETFRSGNLNEILNYTGKRSVYSVEQIKEMTIKNVLVIKFRLSRIVKLAINYEMLLNNKVIAGPPQSIMEIKGEGLSWLKHQLKV